MKDTLYSDIVRKILARSDRPEKDGFDTGLWGLIEEAGFDLLLAPEADGGAGDAFAAASEALIALGEAGAAVPLAETMAGGWCLGAAGLPVTAGVKGIVFAGPDEMQAEEDVLTPRAPLWVPWGDSAGHLVVITALDDGLLACVVKSINGVEATTPAGEPGARLEAGSTIRVLSNIADAEKAVAVILSMKMSEMLGAAERACGLSIEYASVRKQFGRPLSKFQAIQHMAARMASEAAAMRSATETAVAALLSETPLMPAAMGWSRCCEAAGQVAAAAHQIHGAIGYTREYELQHLTRRLYTWRDLYGKETYWYRRLGRQAIAGGADWLWPALSGGEKA